MVKSLKSLFKFSGKFEKNLTKVNLIFIVIFLNIWDFLISKELFNAMIIGTVMFAPAAILWHIGKFRMVVLVTLISIIQFVVMAVLVFEGVELSGGRVTAKSIFWLPYLAMAGVNGFWGLKIYSEKKEKKN